MTTTSPSSQRVGRPQTSVNNLQRVSRRRRPNLAIFFGLFLGLSVLLLLTGITAVQLRFANRVFAGVRVAGVDLSELTRDQAAARLQEQLTPYQGPTILLRFGEQAWPLAGSDLGVQIDARASAERAYQLGRKASPLAALLEQWQLVRAGANLAPALTIGEAQVTDLLHRIAQAIDRPAHDATVTIQGLQVVTTASQVGRHTNLQATWAAVQAQLARGESGTVDVTVQEVLPTVDDVEAVAAQARRWLHTPLRLSYAGDTANDEAPQQFAIDPVQLASWLRITPQPAAAGGITLTLQVDEAALQRYAEDLAARLARPTTDARLHFDPETGRLRVASPSQIGRALDVAETVTRTLVALRSGGAEVDLPLQVVKPAVDMRDLDQMGIRELVASGTTTFKGSSAARIANIRHGAEQFEGVVVPPNGIFSFNRIVGDVSAANGYEDSLVIWGDRTAVGIGGGICQVSTTVFRAAFWGGMPIVERWAHGYVVNWYGEPGMDATIFTPSVDFRFRNDTGAYLLIQPDLDLQQGRLTFNFYGAKPNRTVERIGPEITNVRKPEPPLYQLDPTLAPGARKQVDWAVDGRDVVVTRVIKQGDQVLRQDKFVSKYQPWRAVYLVGPTPAPGG
jgi:vancomycin resistance protein YoaR